jgi:hypothetical protein
LSPLFGYSTLVAEPFNLACYVVVLCLVFAIECETGGARVGRIAAVTVARWPPLVLHTTQVLKDRLFSALALILVVVTWLTRTYDWARSCS